MIHARHAPTVAVMLGLALVPTVIHSYRGSRLDDAVRTARIATSLEGMNSTPTGRRPGWVQSTFETTDWIERTYVGAGGEITLFVARSYDAKRLYHHPELALLRGTQTTPAGVVTSRARPDVPLHVIGTSRNMTPGVALYALHYDGGYIDNPVLFQLRTAFELLVSRRKPLTLFMASSLSGAPDTVQDAPATRLLLAAIADFERQAAGGAGR